MEGRLKTTACTLIFHAPHISLLPFFISTHSPSFTLLQSIPHPKTLVTSYLRPKRIKSHPCKRNSLNNTEKFSCYSSIYMCIHVFYSKQLHKGYQYSFFFLIEYTAALNMLTIQTLADKEQHLCNHFTISQV